MSNILQRTLNVFIRSQGKVFRTDFNVGTIDVESETPIPTEQWSKGYKFPEDFEVMSDKSGIAIWESYSLPTIIQQPENKEP